MEELDDEELRPSPIEKYLLMNEEEKDLEMEKAIKRIRITNRKILTYELYCRK